MAYTKTNGVTLPAKERKLALDGVPGEKGGWAAAGW